MVFEPEGRGMVTYLVLEGQQLVDVLEVQWVGVMSDLASSGALTWPLVPNFPPGLFKGLAEYYAKYRPAYPPALLGDLVTRAGVVRLGTVV